MDTCGTLPYNRQTYTQGLSYRGDGVFVFMSWLVGERTRDNRAHNALGTCKIRLGCLAVMAADLVMIPDPDVEIEGRI